MLAAPALFDSSMTNDWAGVSGKGHKIIPRWRPNKKRKGHLSPQSETNILSFATFLTPLVSHWSLPLIQQFLFEYLAYRSR
jgi:hypothetical protein